MASKANSGKRGPMTKRTRGGKDSVHKRHFIKSSALLSMGDVVRDEVDPAWKIVTAREPLWFHISADHAKRAKKGDARFCVVALALDDATGHMYDYQIGAGVVKIFDIKAKIEVRFKTPGVLQRQLRKFDMPNGKWDLPPGMYRLHPMPASWREVKKRKKAAAKVKVAMTRKKSTRAPVTRMVLRHGGIKRLAEMLAKG